MPAELRLAPLKRALIWLASMALGAVVASTVVLGATSIERAETGADPESALTDPWAASRRRATAVAWLPDAEPLLREVEPMTRAAVARAWIDSVDHPEDNPTDVFTSHRAAVWFYSLDGQVMGLTLETERLVAIDHTPARVAERYDVVMVLRDGDWRLERTRRTLSDS